MGVFAGTSARLVVPAMVVLALGACSPKVPDSGAGVGFGGYSSYEKQRAAREDQLQGNTTPATGVVSDEAVSETPLAHQNSGTTATASSNNVGISDEQDFAAVSARESIASDRERLARRSEQYVQIAPKAVPTGSGGVASVVKFALSTTNSVGESTYKRSGAFAKSRFAKNCAKYTSASKAQAAFLKDGGPQKDRKGLDPDGDGFACSWDPQPFRNAKLGG